MKLDKERFIQDLEEWHESHLDYYANFVEHIKEDGHNGLSGMMNVMSEFYPNTQSQIRDGMNNPSNDLSSAIERVESSGFTEEMVGRFQKGDDHAAAALYFIMIGGGLIIMFTIAYDLWHDKKLSLKSLGLSRLLLSKLCKRLVKTSLAAGYDTAEDWREAINTIYEGQENKPDIEEYLTAYAVPEELDSNNPHFSQIEEEAPEQTETPVQDDGAKAVEEPEATPNSTMKPEKEQPLSAFIFCEEDKKEQVVDFIIKELTRDNSGKSVACLKLALEELHLSPEGKLKPFHQALEKTTKIVRYRQANSEYQNHIYLRNRDMKDCSTIEDREHRRMISSFVEGIKKILQKNDEE